MKKFFREIFAPAGMMASLIIGAGMFSLPYVFARSGVVVGIIYLALMALVAIQIHRSYAEVIETAGNDHRFVGYAKKYLGKGGEIIGSAAVLGGIAITLTIYLILSASFINLIFPGAPGAAAVLVFWVMGSVLVALGIKKFAGLDVLFFLGIALISAAIFIFGIFSGKATAFNVPPLDVYAIFLPLAPVLFSLSGRSAISSIREYFTEGGYSRRDFERAITLGTIIPVIVYAAFVAGITMLSPKGVAPDAVSGLSSLPLWSLCMIGVLGLLAIITSYVFLGLELKGILEKDIKIGKAAAALIVIFVPIALYFAGFNNFLVLIGFVGGVFLAIENILTIMMRRVATLRHSPYDLILITIFVAAMAYELVVFIK